MASSALKLRDLKRTFITPEGVDLRLELGSAGSRAAAFLIDLVIMVIVLLAMTFGALYLFSATLNDGELDRRRPIPRRALAHRFLHSAQRLVRVVRNGQPRRYAG